MALSIGQIEHAFKERISELLEEPEFHIGEIESYGQPPGDSHEPCKQVHVPLKSLAVLTGLGQLGISRWSCARCITVCAVSGIRKNYSTENYADKAAELTVS